MITAVLIATSIAVPKRLASQPTVVRGIRDSIPSFDQLAREVLVVRLQAEALRGSISAALRGQRDGITLTIGTPPWRDSVRSAQRNLERVESGVRRLEVSFRAARQRRGGKLIAELTALLGKARRALGDLSRAEDVSAARIASTHLVAGLEALLQTIDEGKKCCQMSEEP